MKPYRIIIFSILSSLLLFSTPGFTYSGITHKAVSKEALKGSIVDSYLKNNLAFSKGVEEKISGQDGEKFVYDWIMDGSSSEDEPRLRCKNHFHNPLKLWNEAGLSDIFSGDSSILWAQNTNQSPGGRWSWKNARDYYYLALTSVTKEERDNNFANMFRSLGQVMHLIEDSSVPAHSRNDTHLLYNYEDWVKGANLDSFLTNPLFFDEAILDITPNSLAPIPIARIVDTDKYVGANPGVGVGNSIGLSEYANINFLSRDTIFTDNYPESHKHYFPHPKFENTNYKALATEVAEDGEVDKVRYVSGYGVDYLAGVTLSRRVIKKLKEDGADDIDPDFWRKRGFTNKYDKCYENYAKLLLPRAVGYSAGLLNYFFRGKLDAKIVPVKGKGQNKSELKIKNKSDENMSNGTLTFLYENKDGKYIELKKQSGVKIDAGEEYKDKFRFNKPKEKVINYILVFRGKLGQEEDAVVGKVWKIVLEDNCVATWWWRDSTYVPGSPDGQHLAARYQYEKMKDEPDFECEWRIYYTYPEGYNSLSVWCDSEGVFGRIEIYEVDPETFDIKTVTWNTQPSLGRLIGVKDFGLPDVAYEETPSDYLVIGGRRISPSGWRVINITGTRGICLKSIVPSPPPNPDFIKGTHAYVFPLRGDQYQIEEGMQHPHLGYPEFVDYQTDWIWHYGPWPPAE